MFLLSFFSFSTKILIAPDISYLYEDNFYLIFLNRKWLSNSKTSGEININLLMRALKFKIIIILYISVIKGEDRKYIMQKKRIRTKNND